MIQQIFLMAAGTYGNFIHMYGGNQIFIEVKKY
jgi:hypothetical protein